MSYESGISPNQSYDLGMTFETINPTLPEWVWILRDRTTQKDFVLIDVVPLVNFILKLQSDSLFVDVSFFPMGYFQVPC